MRDTSKLSAQKVFRLAQGPEQRPIPFVMEGTDRTEGIAYAEKGQNFAMVVGPDGRCGVVYEDRPYPYFGGC